jgi:Ras-related protein Rab-32
LRKKVGKLIKSDFFFIFQAGQERFGHMTRVYYKDAVGAFIVCDVTRAATFEAVSKWKKDLDQKVELPDGRLVPCVLIGNKVGSVQGGRGKNWADKNNWKTRVTSA